MAKLSAYGRRELWRTQKTITLKTEGEPKTYDAIEETRKYAAMSDGSILSQSIITWRDGQKHNYGWKKGKKFTAEQQAKALENLKAKGFDICSSN